MYWLGEREVHVWWVLLSADERQARRRQAQRSLLSVLGLYLERPVDASELIREGDGKPELSGGELKFNLTHSGGLAAVAVASKWPVGIDVEKPREWHDERHMLERLCSPRERSYLGSPRAAADELLRFWVRKEAVLKAIGSGLTHAVLRNLDVYDDEVGEEWRLHDLKAEYVGYRAAVAVDRRIERVIDRGVFEG